MPRSFFPIREVGPFVEEIRMKKTNVRKILIWASLPVLAVVWGIGITVHFYQTKKQDELKYRELNARLMQLTQSLDRVLRPKPPKTSRRSRRTAKVRKKTRKLPQRTLAKKNHKKPNLHKINKNYKVALHQCEIDKQYAPSGPVALQRFLIQQLECKLDVQKKTLNRYAQILKK